MTGSNTLTYQLLFSKIKIDDLKYLNGSLNYPKLNTKAQIKSRPFQKMKFYLIASFLLLAFIANTSADSIENFLDDTMHLPCYMHWTCDGCMSNPDCYFCQLYTSYGAISSCVSSEQLNYTQECSTNDYWNHSTMASNLDECPCLEVSFSGGTCDSCVADSNCGMYYLEENKVSGLKDWACSGLSQSPFSLNTTC